MLNFAFARHHKRQEKPRACCYATFQDLYSTVACLKYIKSHYINNNNISLTYVCICEHNSVVNIYYIYYLFSNQYLQISTVECQIAKHDKQIRLTSYCTHWIHSSTWFNLLVCKLSSSKMYHIALIRSRYSRQASYMNVIMMITEPEVGGDRYTCRPLLMCTRILKER